MLLRQQPHGESTESYIDKRAGSPKIIFWKNDLPCITKKFLRIFHKLWSLYSSAFFAQNNFEKIIDLQPMSRQLNLCASSQDYYDATF